MAIEPGTEERYLQMAQGNSGMLCSEAPIQILEACSAEAEPTKFLEDFFAAGYGQWVLDNHGRRLPKEIVNNAIIVLWTRACRMHTSILLGEQDPDWGKPFFSDLGLYGE